MERFPFKQKIDKYFNMSIKVYLLRQSFEDGYKDQQVLVKSLI